MSVTRGSPTVRVPVLSKTIMVSRWAFSRLSPPLMRIPFSAPIPVPTMTAVGVASPMAQGQAMMRTETKLSRARVKTGSGTKKAQTTKVIKAMAMTAGTKTAATRSAIRWMGALEPWASSTRRMIWASAVSAPIFVARKVKLPLLLIVAPKTSIPGSFVTGMLSPVSMDSSTAEAPVRTTPSVGIFSPGRTRISSPFMTSSTGMSAGWPSRITRAVLGLSPMRRLIAWEVFPFVRASRSRPNTMKLTMKAAPS